MSDEQGSDEQLGPETSGDAEFEVEDVNLAEVKSRGNGVAWIAVLFSVVALAAVAFTLFKDWRSNDASTGLDNLASIDGLDRRMTDFDGALENLAAQIDAVPQPDFSDELDAVRRDVEEQIHLLNSLPSRMSSIENTVASLAGISAGARETFLLAEGEYYLQIANAQLQLANNPQLASLALGMADERITQLSDPALTAVRRAISDELATLEVMQKPDIEGATLTLASLARVAQSLPVADASAGGDENSDEIDPDAGNLDRAWGSVKDAMSGLVRVTPPDEAKLALISPDAEYFLRNNVALQLQSARLALLRGEQVIFEQTLDDISALLNRYFDADSEQVASAQQTIADIRSKVFTAALPDISDSLRLLRQYRTLRETRE